MCTYETERITVTGSAKGAEGWFRATDATIYYDHPVHFGAGHALMVDVINPSLGPSSRVGIELNAESARALALAILRSLDSVPASLLES
jgi:hypothetical protein